MRYWDLSLNIQYLLINFAIHILIYLFPPISFLSISPHKVCNISPHISPLTELVGMHLDRSPQSLPKVSPQTSFYDPIPAAILQRVFPNQNPAFSQLIEFRQWRLSPAIWLSNVMWAIRHFITGTFHPFYRHFMLQNFAAQRTLLCFLSSEIEWAFPFKR